MKSSADFEIRNEHQSRIALTHQGGGVDRLFHQELRWTRKLRRRRALALNA
jgi:hypothetical protein